MFLDKKKKQAESLIKSMQIKLLKKFLNINKRKKEK